MTLTPPVVGPASGADSLPTLRTTVATSHSRESRIRIRPLRRVGLVLLFLLLVAGIGIAPRFPRDVTPASAPLEVFSAERALTPLPTIAAEPHPSGSAAQARVRDYLVQQLTALGLEAQIQRTVANSPLRLESSAQVDNVVARLRGNAVDWRRAGVRAL
jgi:hypothetical protein